MTDFLTTYKFRLRSKHDRHLNKKASAVNSVWNFCNATQQESVRRGGLWMSWVSLINLTSGSSKIIGLSSDSIQQVCRAYDAKRRQQGKAWLKFRGYKRLGWVPFLKGTVRLNEKGFRYHSRDYTPMHWREMPKGSEILSGSFSQNGKGNWYINIVLRLRNVLEAKFSGAVGIDLGLKAMATTSDGLSIEAPQFYRKSEAILANSQRARKTKQIKSIHRKIANRRKDFLHKQANALVQKYGTIIVGDVSPSKLTKTTMAKSVNDVSWATFKNMLRYKSVMNGGRMIEVNEAYTTQTCSCCGSLPNERPKGIAGLGIREFKCGDCGTVLDRDVNAARNILRIGLDTLTVGVAA